MSERAASQPDPDTGVRHNPMSPYFPGFVPVSY